MEIHHIVPSSEGGQDTEDNGIPLCFDCHADVGAYNTKHPKGRKFTPSELRKHKEQWFAICAKAPWQMQGRRATTANGVASPRRDLGRSQEPDEDIRAKLFRLSPWQRSFIQRFVLENRNQIPEFEVGQYKAAWDFEMAVLIDKGIVREIPRSGVYEINTTYYNYLMQHWDPRTDDLC
jgi:hypothetical protein